MFHKTELAILVYEQYINGISIDDITNYIVAFTEYNEVNNKDVEEIIDFMNKFM
jgi:hypothetical protein